MGELGIKEFIGGTVGGIAQVLSGQPFDIIKVRQATSVTPINAMSAALTMVKQEGVLAFWRGSTAPLLGVGACVSIQFGVLENSKRLVQKSKGKSLETWDYIFCGAIAGMANTIVSAPAEHFRIKMQVQGKVDPRGDPLYKSDGDCIKSIFKNHGIAGAYRGFWITLLREAVTFGSYFGAYEYIVNYHLIPKGGTKKDVEAWKLFCTGGFSGYFYWAPWYPIDAIKSKLQADSFTNPRFNGFIDCAKKTLASEGLAGFYKGFWPCMLRAFPVNATTFLAYELTMRVIS
ncbi:hypothetical protein SteCoe_35463 [Stentor coeruleus]|uniref:Mitochondrial carrier protein n=1 Tax=Stentor coeruleus TaxID=5963 RepID=A0A1R2ASF6_9CILI|nr:hypothetical protein SteCoe_35463 [Stentor coeruleus]